MNKQAKKNVKIALTSESTPADSRKSELDTKGKKMSPTKEAKIHVGRF